MKSRTPIAATLLLSIMTATSFAQRVTSRGAESQTLLPNGASLYFSTRVTAKDEQKLIPTQLSFHRENVVSRILLDEVSGVWFGYDLTVEPIEGTKQFKFTVKNLNPEVAQQLQGNEWFRNATAKGRNREFNISLPHPRLIDDGDTIELTLMVNRTTGDAMTDLITVRSKASKPPSEPNNRTARDFTLEAATLKVLDYRLLVNGQMVTEDQPSGGVSGALISIYLPDHGRFTFSMAPREDYGFEKTAVIEKNQISFSANGNNYAWTSKSLIFCCDGKWNLWMKHEPDYQPAGDLLKFASADEKKRCCIAQAADAPEYLFNESSLANNPVTVTKSQSTDAPKIVIGKIHNVPRNKYAPELYADTLQLKHTLVNLPGADSPESNWELKWQVFFVSEAEAQRITDQRVNALPPGGSKFLAWNPRPEDYPERILLASGTFNKAGLAGLEDRTDLSQPFSFKSAVPDTQRTARGMLMTHYVVKIHDAKLGRSFTREGIWQTLTGFETSQTPPRNRLYSNFFVTGDGQLFGSQTPHETKSTEWTVK